MPPPVKTPFLTGREQFVDERGKITAQGLRVLRMAISSFADSVTPTGVIDGVNKVFTLPVSPNPVASFKLRKRAAAATSWTLMALTTGYTLSGITITYVTAPSVGDLHECDFRFLSPP